MVFGLCYLGHCLGSCVANIFESCCIRIFGTNRRKCCETGACIPGHFPTVPPRYKGPGRRVIVTDLISDRHADVLATPPQPSRPPQSSQLLNLPEDVQRNVMSNLNLRGMINVRQTCSALGNLALEEIGAPHRAQSYLPRNSELCRRCSWRIVHQLFQYEACVNLQNPDEVRQIPIYQAFHGHMARVPSQVMWEAAFPWNFPHPQSKVQVRVYDGPRKCLIAKVDVTPNPNDYKFRVRHIMLAILAACTHGEVDAECCEVVEIGQSEDNNRFWGPWVEVSKVTYCTCGDNWSVIVRIRPMLRYYEEHDAPWKTTHYLQDMDEEEALNIVRE